MKFKAKNILAAALVAVALLTGVSAANAGFAVTFDRPALENLAQVDDTTTLIGWSFTASTDLNVTKLGLWDWERDQKPEMNHFVGLWDNAGRLLTSVTINEPSAPAHPNTPWRQIRHGRNHHDHHRHDHGVVR